MRTLPRRQLLALATPLLLPAAARAQAFPAKPIRIVHGYSAASNPDTIARVIAQTIREKLPEITQEFLKER